MPDLPPVVEAPWLAANLDEVIVADVRWQPGGDARAGWQAYLAGHLPGAAFVDLERDLAADAGPVVGRHPLPDPERFAATMRRIGVCEGDTVVAYDDAGGAHAARLVWMLRVTGRQAAVLDGGLDAWEGELSSAATVRPRGDLRPAPWPEQALADADEVERLRRREDAVVLDVRDRDRYLGEREPYDERAGHIPGAVNAPFRDNLGPDGRFAPAERLRERFASLGADRAEEVVVHCGSGITACHGLLALERAGIQGARLYPGSWSGWSTDDDRPVATGER